MEKPMELFDLPFEDIIISNILPYISLRECFHFRCVSKTALEIVTIYFAKLKSVELRNKKISPHTFKVFAETCTKLTLLNLSRSDMLDSDLIPLLLHNRRLVTLNLSNCTRLSAKCLQPIILYCNDMTVLKLARCTWLTTGALEALALHQCGLVEVDLSHCPLITESCVLIFIKKFRCLKTFSLEGNLQITDKTLYALAKYTKELKFLNLGGCDTVTDRGIRALANHSRNLSGLLVRGCTKVTEQSMRVLRDRLYKETCEWAGRFGKGNVVIPMPKVWCARGQPLMWRDDLTTYEQEWWWVIRDRDVLREKFAKQWGIKG